MPRITSRGNFQGLDTRPGAVDSSLNTAAAMDNIVLRDKDILKRKGHQKIHDDAIRCASVLWDDTSESSIRIGDFEFVNLTSAGGWSFEFAVRFETLPSAGVRLFLNGPLNAQVASTGIISVGSDTGGGAVFLASATALTVDTDHYISVTYDPAGAGTLILYINGVSDATDAAYGTPNTPTTIDQFVGSAPAGTALGDLRICDFRVWDDTRTPTEVALWDSRQLTDAEILNADLEHYWKMDEGTGDTAADSGSLNITMNVCYNPFANPLVPGSNGALRVFDVEKAPIAENEQRTSPPAGWQNWRNGDNITHEFFIKFDEVPTDSVAIAWQYAIMPCGSATTTTAGMVFSIESVLLSTLYKFRLDYFHPTIPGEDRTVTVDVPGGLVLGQVYRITCQAEFTGGTRTIRLFSDGVLLGALGAAATTPAGIAPNTGMIVALDKVTAVPSLASDRIDYTVDDIRTWGTVFRTTPEILDVGEHALYDTDLDDLDLAAYWPLDERVGRSKLALFAKPFTDFNTVFWANRPDAQYFGTGCPIWSFGLVTCYDPCDRGEHNFIGSSAGLNEVIVHGVGASYKVNETTRLLEVLGPFSPQGDQLVTSINFSKADGRSYFADGESFPWRYDGTTLFRAGIAAPGVAPSQVGVGGGVGWPAGDYKAGYTYVGKSPDGIEYESAMSPLVEFTIATVLSIDFASIVNPTDPQVDSVQIYITKKDGEILFKAERFPTPLASGLATVTNLEVDLSFPEKLNRDAPSRFAFMLERDGRMIWSGDPESPRLYFFSEVGFPEYVGILSSREHTEDITGLALGVNNELYVWGKTSRQVLFGPIENKFNKAKPYYGGCLSHHSLELVPPGWIHGMGPDGPFRSSANIYVPIDEFTASGRIVGSIRDKLNIDDDKDQWDNATTCYDPDKKILFFAIPKDTAREESEIIPLQVDLSAWTEWGDWFCSGVCTLRKTVAGFVEMLGSAIEGFVCRLDDDAEGSEKDGLADADAHEFTISSFIAAEASVTLTATPTSTGDGVKGLTVWVLADDFATTKFRTFAGIVKYQDTAKLFLDLTSAEMTTIFTGATTIHLGVFRSLYETKRLDARTITNRKKLFRWLDMEVEQTSSTANMKIQYAGLDDSFSDFDSSDADLLSDMSESRDIREDIQIGTQRLATRLGTVDPVPMRIASFSVEYEQQGPSG